MSQLENKTSATRNLQQRLLQLSYHNSDIPPTPVDGIFERDTGDALRAFQRTEGLPPDGIADRVTWEALENAYRASLAENTPPRAVFLFPALPGARLSLGDRGFAVAALQQMLSDLSHDYDELSDVSVSGTYDEATRDAVSNYQRLHSLPVTGTVEKPTWNAIADRYNILFSIQPYL